MRIDAHHHQWDRSVFPQPWTAGISVLQRDFGPDEFTPALQAEHLDGAVLVHALPDAEETSWLLATAQKNPRILGTVGWLDLTCADLSDRLSELRAGAGGHGLVGLRNLVQAEHDPGWLTRPSVLRGLRALAAAGLTYDLVIRADQIDNAIAAVRAVPELRFVLDHAGNPPVGSDGRDWSSSITALAGLPNVAVKLSGLVTRFPERSWSVGWMQVWADVVLDAFGPGRTMFGSDWPVCLMAASYGQVVDVAQMLTAGLSSDERADVFGGTAARWYRLETS